MEQEDSSYTPTESVDQEVAEQTQTTAHDVQIVNSGGVLFVRCNSCSYSSKDGTTDPDEAEKILQNHRDRKTMRPKQDSRDS